MSDNRQNYDAEEWNEQDEPTFHEAWEMLGYGTLCFGIVAYKALPIRRGVLGKAMIALLLCSAVYFPVMWNSTRIARRSCDTVALIRSTCPSNVFPG